MSPALEVKDLRKSYGKTDAVRGVSFTLAPGDFFGFLGPNGAGKTTTINCIVGVSTPTSGAISVFGKDVVTDYRDARKHVGVAPQEFNIDPFASTEKLLWYVAGYFGIPVSARAERINRLLLDFELLPHKEKPFLKLSGGLKRRVMLARAMIHDPDLLILDEPTAGVDVELRLELWRYLREINARGKTILLTSHYLEEVEQLCSRIAIINKGELAYLGTKEELLKDGVSLETQYLAYTKSEAKKITPV